MIEHFLLWDRGSAGKAVGSDGAGDLWIIRAMMRRLNPIGLREWIQNSLVGGTRGDLGWAEDKGDVMGGRIRSPYIPLVMERSQERVHRSIVCT